MDNTTVATTAEGTVYTALGVHSWFFVGVCVAFFFNFLCSVFVFVKPV